MASQEHAALAKGAFCSVFLLTRLTLGAPVLSSPGLDRLIAPLLANSEAQVDSVLGSQQNLSAAIDRLVGGARLPSSPFPLSRSFSLL